MTSADWSTRNVLRLYPQRWRDEFEQEVIGTLLDVAESEQRTRPSLAELVPLALRGAWLRARGSVVFWVGLVIIAVMIWGVGQSFDGFLSERYWPVVLAKAGTGLVLALPLAGACAAWQAGRRRSVVPLPRRLKNLLLDAAGPAIFVGIGYLAAIVGQLLASGWPLSLTPDAGSPLAFLSMLLAALAVGSLLGTLAHRMVAAPLAWIALSFWYFLSSLTGDPAWSNLTGLNVSGWGPSTLYEVSQPVVVATTSIAALAIVVLTVGLIVAKVTRGWVWAGVLALLIAIAVPVNSAALTATPGLGPAARPATDLVCEGDAPRICLWPEQDAASGDLVRGTITGAYQRAVALGFPVEPVVSVLDREGATYLYYRQQAMVDRLLTNYAAELTYPFACYTLEGEQLPTTTNEYELAQGAAAFAAAWALGADMEAARPVIQMGGDASEAPTKTLTLAETEDY